MEGVDKFLKKQAEAGLLRNLKPVSRRYQGRIIVKDKEYIDFSSNDYLGLSAHPRLIRAAKDAIDEFGVSSSASRLLSGDLILHHKLEEKIAQFKKKDTALVFNSGYQGNLGAISALFTKDDCIFSDRLNHASIIDGILLSGAKSFRFRHNDAGHLESLLKKERVKGRKALIITETVFSMDGDKCLLKDLVRLKEKYNCEIMVDEAHATGIFGKNGSGVVEEEGLWEQVDFIMGTFGKALGGFGAYLAASGKTVHYLINTCRGFIYSTALPPGIISANLEGIGVVEDEPSRREILLKSARYFRDALKASGFNVKGDSQIVPVIVGDNLKAVEFAGRLQEKGYWILPIRPPTVPRGEARLRFSLTFYHTKEILQKLIDDIREIKI
ncbi:MAG: 8-amino-7-oxononanoate synthase [Candidatus Omnitrophota bacterium]|nr:8-amino-7-oxononanoate synthase [Candidatus Omnitrophota bacterium]